MKPNAMKTIRPIIIYWILTATLALGAPSGLWGDLMRSGARGDDAIGAAARSEKVAAELAHGSATRKALGRDIGDVADAAARERKLKALLDAALYNPDPALMRSIGTLSQNEMEAALVLARGSRRLIDVTPDVAARGRLLSAGGSDLVAAIGLHGDDLAREATHLDALVAAGKVPALISNQTSLARFSELMRAGEGGAWTFWRHYVTPYWKKWAVAGTLAAYLANPELFHNAAGEVTEEGARRLSEALGVIVTSALTGSGEGGSKTAQEIWLAFKKHFLSGPSAWGAWLGLGLVIWFVGTLLPRTRRICLAPLTWLLRKPTL